MTTKKVDQSSPVESDESIVTHDQPKSLADVADKFYAEQIERSKNSDGDKVNIKTVDSFEKEIPSPKKLIGPGFIKLESSIFIHTRQTYGLVLGRRHRKDNKKFQNPVLGLFGFATRTFDAIHAAENDNPYADLLLMRLEKRLKEFESAVNVSLETVKKMVKTNLEERGIKAKLAESTRPQEIVLSFFSPYAYELALLLIQYDFLVRAYFPLRQMRIVSYEQWLLAFVKPYKAYCQVVNPFLAFRGDMTTITREQYNAHFSKPDEVIKRVLLHMGTIPEYILDKTAGPEMIYLRNRKNSHTVEFSEEEMMLSEDGLL